MSTKLTFKSIERQIKAEFYCFDEKILFGKQKTITNLIDSMDSKQYNLFKKYLAYEKRLKTNMCTNIIRNCLTSVIENPQHYNLSSIKKDSTD